MNCKSLGRGRGFGPRGARGLFRPRFPGPPFRHAGPPRPPGPPPFGMPWQANNRFFQPHMLRGNPQFRPGGRKKRFYSYDVRFPAPSTLPALPEYEEAAYEAAPPYWDNSQMDNNQAEPQAAPQLPLPGSEEERQQKIAETADRLKQKLSCFDKNETLNVWTEDMSNNIEDNSAENINIPVHRYETSELNLTDSDLKDIGRTNSDNLMHNSTPHLADVFNDVNNINRDVMLDENNDGSQVEMVFDGNQMTNLVNVDNNLVNVDNDLVNVDQYMEMNEGEQQELLVDTPHNLERSNLHQDINQDIENQNIEPLESNIQCYNIPLANISQDQYEQQQMDLSQETLLPVDSADQEILYDCQEESVINSEFQKDVSYDNCAPLQPVLANIPVIINATDNQSPRMQESSLRNGPPELSPHIEQELPVDFDPTTPPPILFKQDQPHVPPPLPDLPLFNPAEPPPNMRPFEPNIPHESANPAWSNVQNPMPMAAFVQQLPLEQLSGQSNIFMPPPHIEAINYSPVYSVPPSINVGINTNIISVLPQMPIMPQTPFVPLPSLPEPPPPSDLHCNKDDVLNDMQEAMRFAKEMTEIVEKDENSTSTFKSPSEGSVLINPIGDINSIALPPGKPKVKINKPKKKKQREYDTHNEQSVFAEQSTSSHPSPEDTAAQDAQSAKSKQASLMNEHDRPKVVFNLNNKTKVVNVEWADGVGSEARGGEKRNGMMQPDAKKATSSAVKRNLENTSTRSKKEERTLRKSENTMESKTSIDSVRNQNAAALPHRKVLKHARAERSQSTVPLCPKAKPPPPRPVRNRAERTAVKSSDFSWKNKIISRFLKMSKNDIYNMVNNTSLRKFDIIMKRLVKEKKHAISLGMRQAQDEKMKLYDQQEFMKQLNNMLDSDTIESITDLPTEFIHHLNEVLQLDTQFGNRDQSAAVASSSHSEPPATRAVAECAAKTTAPSGVGQDASVRSKSHVDATCGSAMKSKCDKDAQVYSAKSNDLNPRNDISSIAASNDTDDKLLSLQHEVDNIFSEVTKKIQVPAAAKERKQFGVPQRDARKLNDGATQRSVQKDYSLLESDRTRKWEISARWLERRWKRKEREDPRAYRNLTKEEWEAKYGMQASSQTVPTFSVVKKLGSSKNILKRARGRRILPRRRHSSESSRQPSVRRSRTLEKDKHKESRRHSDDRRHTVAYTETIRLVRDSSNNSKNNNSGVIVGGVGGVGGIGGVGGVGSVGGVGGDGSSSDSSSDSSDNRENVTKLLREIKEKEKVAKQMSLNETIRDEVNAEIERERKQKSKSRKKRKSSKSGKEKRTHHKKKKKKKHSKKATSSSESSSDKDDSGNEEANERLLTENEIKKERNEVTQQVIIKEEFDMGQEEIVRSAVAANVSSHAAPHLSAFEPRAASKSPPSAPPPAQETTTVGTAQDRMPTASPTQPKTKAQLKQMPETADMNDNKVPLNVFTSLPKDWNTINPAIISTCAENKSCGATDVNRDKAEVSSPAISDAAGSGTADASVSRGESAESATPQPSNALIEQPSSTINTRGDNDTSVSVDVSNKTSTVSAVSAPASVSATANISAQRQGASKKIDIKTYYERTIRRRIINEQGEPKRPADSPAAPAENLPTKIAKREVTVDKSIRDPRLISQAKSTVRDNVAQTTSGKDTRQDDKQTTKESRAEAAASKQPKTEDSNRIVNIEKTDRDNATSSKKNLSIDENAGKKLQRRTSTDSKKFKNIRSEGSKELKLKKETAKSQKKKKKPMIAEKVCCPPKEPATAENAEKIIGETSTDNISSSKVDTERTVLPSITPREDKVDDSSADIKSSVISLRNTDHGKSIKRSSDFVKEAEEEAVAIEGADARERLSIETTCSVERATTSIGIAEKEDEIASEISNVAKPDALITSTAAIAEISNGVERSASEADFSNNEIPQCVATEDTEAALNHAAQITKLNENLSEGANDSIPIAQHDVSDIPELTISRRLDDAESKKGELLTSTCIVSDLEINENTKGNNMKADASEDTYRHASEGDNDPRLKRTAETPTVSNENVGEEQQGNGVVSPESMGSPFKGFLRDAAVNFEQPNLFNFELHDLDDGKKPIDDCGVNCMTDKEMQIGRMQQSTMLEPVDYADNMNISGNFNIAFEDALLASDKECATSERSDKSSLAADGEERAAKSLSEMVATELHVDVDDNDVNTGGGNSETEKQLISDERYASNAELAMKESMFINEEEIIQDEARMKDLTNKLKTTADPSLTDAIDATISDDALRLPDGQGAEQLNNHMYLVSHVSAEKAPCDKLPDFDEHLDNMFYLDDRLQSTAAFDNKDDTSAHFSVHQASPTYDITPTVTPETTMIADLSHEKEEQCEFNFKHISSSVNNDEILMGSTVECSPVECSPVECSPVVADIPRMLNVPTKAALKEAATNLFLKSPNSGATASDVPALLEKTLHRDGTDLNYQTLAWHVNTSPNLKTSTLKTQNDASIAQNFVNISAMSSKESSDKQVRGDLGIGRNSSCTTPSRRDIESRFPNSMQCSVELRKMKETDGMVVEKKARTSVEKVRDSVYKDRKKRKDGMLRNLKDKRRMKRRSRDLSDLTKNLKSMKQSGKTARDGILARMLEIDIEIHKLMTEKLELHERLQRAATSPIDSFALRNSASSGVTENDKTSPSSQAQSMLLSLLAQNSSDENRAKQDKRLSTPKQSIKRRKAASQSSEDDEITHYAQKKMPVIKWKKTPRLETSRREEEDEDEDGNEREQQTSKTSPGKKADGSPSKMRKSESDRDTRAQESAAKKIDRSAKRAIGSENANSSKRWDSIEGEAERAEGRSDLDRRNNVTASPSEPAKVTNSQTLSVQVHSTPEHLAIYSDDSTWDDSLVQNTAAEMHENRNATGLALLDEKIKQQKARTRKLTAIVRRKKKQQLSNILKSVNNLTLDEEDLPLSKLYIKKLRQQRDLLDTLSQKKKDASSAVDSDVMKNIDEVINAVAENRVENLYQSQPEVQAPADIPTTSGVPQADKFYVDVEANANSDWPCREKGDIEEAAGSQQDSNDAPGTDGSNHVFKAVNEDKTFYNERNVESDPLPDGSAIPEETLLVDHSSDYDGAQSKDPNDVASRNFDIKVSVPKTLIKDDFSLELLQKLKDNESGAFINTGLVDSTINTLPNAEKSMEKDRNVPGIAQTLEPTEKEVDPVNEEDEREEKSEKIVEKDKQVAEEAIDDEKDTCKPQEEPEKTDDVRDAQSNVPRSDEAESGHPDAPTVNEDTRDSVASNRFDETAATDAARDVDSVAQKPDTTGKRLDAESEQLSNDTTASRQDDQESAKNPTVQQERKVANIQVTPHAFERVLENEQNTGSSVPPSEKSEESNEVSIEQRSDPEHMSSFNRVADLRKGGEMSKRSRRRCDTSTPVRRSARYSNENVKPKMNDVDSNSNSSEQDSSVHERDLSTRQRSKSPSWAIRDERNLNNVRRNRAPQKEPSARKVLAEPEANAESSIKSNFTTIAESVPSRNNAAAVGKKRTQHTDWQIRNCKVRLIDCKYTFLKQDIDPKILSKFGIIAINPYVSSNISYAQHATWNQQDMNLAATKSTFSAETSCDKDKSEVEVSEAKTIEKSNTDVAQESTSETTEIDERTQYTVHKGPILDIKIFENSFLAASEDGKIYRYSQTSNGILNIYKGHKSAVTCLYIYQSDVAGIKRELMYSGSLDGTLHCYNITTGALVKNPANINSPIQCMDQAWGIIFVGTKSGYVSRFHIKSGVIKGSSIEFSEKSVLALKATNEGPRRILIVASRNQPITIRDAQTGLFLRTISSQKNSTVYSLMRHHNLIYCGTSSTSINVFDFTTGEQAIQYDAGVGIVCMRLYEQLLFAGCYDGNIYVFDTRDHKLVCSIPGPGNMLLSIEVVHNKIIAGSKDKRLHSWQMPIQVRALI